MLRKFILTVTAALLCAVVPTQVAAQARGNTGRRGTYTNHYSGKDRAYRKGKKSGSRNAHRSKGGRRSQSKKLKKKYQEKRIKHTEYELPLRRKTVYRTPEQSESAEATEARLPKEALRVESGEELSCPAPLPNQEEVQSLAVLVQKKNLLQHEPERPPSESCLTPGPQKKLKQERQLISEKYTRSGEGIIRRYAPDDSGLPDARWTTRLPIRSHERGGRLPYFDVFRTHLLSNLAYTNTVLLAYPGLAELGENKGYYPADFEQWYEACRTCQWPYSPLAEEVRQELQARFEKEPEWESTVHQKQVDDSEGSQDTRRLGSFLAAKSAELLGSEEHDGLHGSVPFGKARRWNPYRNGEGDWSSARRREAERRIFQDPSGEGRHEWRRPIKRGGNNWWSNPKMDWFP